MFLAAGSFQPAPWMKGVTMILGMTALTFVHVVISLIGIFLGFVVIFGMLAAKRLDRWTALFLAATVATSVTGFFFPFHGVTPGHILGILSLIALALAIFARYGRQLAGGWRKTYVITAVIAQYLNFFVLIVQSFQKVPALKAIAPTQAEGPFKTAQLVALVVFLVLGIAAAIKFRDEAVRAA
jgi:hypothetical protein